ncbi:MAG: hypothetical protein LQ338_002385 [Usnochroma carphineum]|nr:MAG: hypothetical protein LQ338_002385 [Usnochroma carphineum]
MLASGFTAAPVSKYVFFGIIVFSILVSITDTKYLYHIQLVPHLWRYQQYWRLLIWQSCYNNSTELLFGVMAIYHLRIIERLWGSRKFASFLLTSLPLCLLIPPVILAVLHPLSFSTLNILPAGPTPLIFALLAQYYATIPTVYKYRLRISSTSSDALTFSDKSLVYLLAIQLAVSSLPGSVICAATGWFIGIAWRRDIGPGFWTSWRIPEWLAGTKREGGGDFEHLRRRLEGEGYHKRLAASERSFTPIVPLLLVIAFWLLAMLFPGSRLHMATRFRQGSRVVHGVIMNGHHRQFSSSSSINEPSYGAGQHAQIQPSSQTLLNGYRDALQNPNMYWEPSMAKRSRSRSSGPLESHDPVSMHLLMETAMGESQHYDILSIEELEELKKELALLSSRIDATKRKLVLENKIRDAAQSFNRLDTPGSRDSVREGFGRSPKAHRRSILGSRGSMSDMLNKDVDEFAASNRKCEELAQELWRLEKRMQDLQRRLLEHTAGVLQVTHTGFLKNETPPHSPDVFLRHISGQKNGASGDNFYDFDDRSFYRTLDCLLEIGDGPEVFHTDSGHTFAAQNQAILDTERRLEALTSRLTDSITQASAGRGGASEDVGQDVPGANVQAHLDHLEKGIESIQRHRDAAVDEARQLSSRSTFHEEKVGQYETTLAELWEVLASRDTQRDSSGSEESRESSQPSEPFTLNGFSDEVRKLRSRHTNLREQKDILTRQIQQQRELNGKSDAQKDAQISELTAQLERTQIALEDKQREAKETRDELVLVTQHLDNARQEATLQEQQRETSARNALEAEKQARKEREEQLLADLEARQDEQHRLEAELADTRDDHGIAKAGMRAELEESEKRVQQSIAQVEAARESKAHQDAIELSLKQQIDAKTQEAEKAHEEIKGLEGEMVRLHTELTVAKAELDGAYGTRAQRAAEMASNPALQKELDELNERNSALQQEMAALRSEHDRLKSDNVELHQRANTLQQELSDTIGEYETMTKASIEFEKDREALEAQLDNLRDRSEELEAQLGEEKLKWIGVKSPMAAGSRDSSVPGSTSANVLKNEFKKMMREMRAENMKALRLEHEERRKLEAVMRTLKKDQTPGKSSLIQSETAS